MEEQSLFSEEEKDYYINFTQNVINKIKEKRDLKAYNINNSEANLSGISN